MARCSLCLRAVASVAIVFQISMCVGCVFNLVARDGCQ